MPLLSFQEQFVEAVENGLDLRAGRPLRHPGVRPKTQSIRAYWKNGHNPHRAGLTEKMWTKVRTPERRKLGEAVAKSVEEVRIYRLNPQAVGVVVELFNMDGGIEWAPDFFADPFQAEQRFARRDGFKNWTEMYRWFEKTHGLPFKGVLIRW